MLPSCVQLILFLVTAARVQAGPLVPNGVQIKELVSAGEALVNHATQNQLEAFGDKINPENLDYSLAAMQIAHGGIPSAVAVDPSLYSLIIIETSEPEETYDPVEKLENKGLSMLYSNRKDPTKPLPEKLPVIESNMVLWLMKPMGKLSTVDSLALLAALQKSRPFAVFENLGLLSKLEKSEALTEVESLGLISTLQKRGPITEEGIKELFAALWSIKSRSDVKGMGGLQWLRRLQGEGVKIAKELELRSQQELTVDFSIPKLSSEQAEDIGILPSDSFKPDTYRY